MNSCIYTGVTAQFSTNAGISSTVTGDLFYTPEEGFTIRGIPKTCFEHPVWRIAMLTVAAYGYPAPALGDIVRVRAENPQYYDTRRLQILNYNQTFRNHIEQWYPELLNISWCEK